MVAENNLYTIRLFDLLAMDGGEQFFEPVANSFVSKNADSFEYLCYTSNYGIPVNRIQRILAR
jgi:hypothetical protein